MRAYDTAMSKRNNFTRDELRAHIHTPVLHPCRRCESMTYVRLTVDHQIIVLSSRQIRSRHLNAVRILHTPQISSPNWSRWQRIDNSMNINSLCAKRRLRGICGGNSAISTFVEAEKFSANVQLNSGIVIISPREYRRARSE